MPAASGSDNWPEYRGPLASGHATASHVPTRWSEQLGVRWKVPVHGRGLSTPVVWRDQIWLTTANADGTEMFALCVDRHSGDVLFDRMLLENSHPEALGNDINTYASPSAVIDSGRVYVHFGSYGTVCVDTRSFDVVWQRRDLPCSHYRGPASSPVLVDNLLVFHMDGVDLHYIIALDKTTGATVWKQDRSTDYGDLDESGQPADGGDWRKAFNTPLLVEVAGRQLLISPSAKAIYAYDPHSGEEVWQVRHQGHSTAARTLFDGEHVYCNTGWGETALYKIDPRGTGDITDTHVKWRLRQQMPRCSSPVLVEGLIYSCSDNGVLTCVDAAGGDIVWRQRLGGQVAASLLYADGRLYAFNQAGEAVVFRPGRRYRELFRNRLDDGLMASPVAVNSSLILRTSQHLYCLGSGRPVSGSPATRSP